MENVCSGGLAATAHAPPPSRTLALPLGKLEELSCELSTYSVSTHFHASILRSTNPTLYQERASRNKVFLLTSDHRPLE